MRRSSGCRSTSSSWVKASSPGRHADAPLSLLRNGAPSRSAGEGARHLYVHLPFCSHRCGYCDFVTAVGHRAEHGAYAQAVVAELELERGELAECVETVFLGGGTPTYTEPDALVLVLGHLPPAGELTVEANPETVTPELAALLREHGVNRVSLGAQSLTIRSAAGVPPDAVAAMQREVNDAGYLIVPEGTGNQPAHQDPDPSPLSRHR